MNIPAIGTARGVFELFVPGAFVILNVLAVLYSALDSTAQEQFRELAASPALSLVILICLGYLIGAILRLFGTEMPDRWSAWWNQPHTKNASSDDTAKAEPTSTEDSGPETDQERKSQLWVEADFPYIEWIGLTHRFRHETDSVQGFYRKVWKTVKRENGDRSDREAERWREKTFFNHCKTLINSVDERAATEIYSAEALVRYLTGMFYALLIALILMAIVGLPIQWLLAPTNWGWVVLFGVLVVVYVAMLLAIIRHYRIMRIKEVEIVFSATYRHRELFEL
jgi:hypothetical protein